MKRQGTPFQIEWQADEVEINFNNHSLSLYIEATVSGYVYPEEPPQLYTKNGDGYPGSPAEFEIHSVHIDTVNELPFDCLDPRLKSLLVEWLNQNNPGEDWVAERAEELDEG